MIERLFVCLLAEATACWRALPVWPRRWAAETIATVVWGLVRAACSSRLNLVPADLVGTPIYRPFKRAFDVELGPVSPHDDAPAG